MALSQVVECKTTTLTVDECKTLYAERTVVECKTTTLYSDPDGNSDSTIEPEDPNCAETYDSSSSTISTAASNDPVEVSRLKAEIHDTWNRMKELLAETIRLEQADNDQEQELINIRRISNKNAEATAQRTEEEMLREQLRQFQKEEVAQKWMLAQRLQQGHQDKLQENVQHAKEVATRNGNEIRRQTEENEKKVRENKAIVQMSKRQDVLKRHKDSEMVPIRAHEHALSVVESREQWMDEKIARSNNFLQRTADEIKSLEDRKSAIQQTMQKSWSKREAEIKALMTSSQTERAAALMSTKISSAGLFDIDTLPQDQSNDDLSTPVVPEVKVVPMGKPVPKRSRSTDAERSRKAVTQVNIPVKRAEKGQFKKELQEQLDGGLDYRSQQYCLKARFPYKPISFSFRLKARFPYKTESQIHKALCAANGNADEASKLLKGGASSNAKTRGAFQAQ